MITCSSCICIHIFYFLILFLLFLQHQHTRFRPFLIYHIFYLSVKTISQQHHRWTGDRDQACRKQSDPEQFGYPSVLRLLDVYGEDVWESETQSTLYTPALPSFVSPCGVLHSALWLRLSASTRFGDYSPALPNSLTIW